MLINCQNCNGRGAYNIDGILKSCKTCFATGQVECPCDLNQEQIASVGKTRWELMPWAPLREVAEILTLGAAGHGDTTWQTEPKSTHIDAAMRHITSYLCGEKLSDDMYKHHLAHAVTRLLFVLGIEGEEK